MHTSPDGEMWFDWGGEALMLVAHTKKKPDAATWTAMCEAIAAALETRDELRTLVFTDGGGPSSSQRDELAAVTKGKRYRVGVVTGASAVRFIVSSMAFFNPTIKSFPPVDWRRSLEYLGVPPAELEEVAEEVRRLSARPGGDRFSVLNTVLSTEKSMAV